MSFTFDASKQQVTTSATNAPISTMAFGVGGTGDAGKPTGFAMASTPQQNAFGSDLSNTPAQGGGYSFGTPVAAPPSSTTIQQTPNLTFGLGTTVDSGITPGATTIAPATGFPAPTHPTGFPTSVQAQPTGFPTSVQVQPSGFPTSAPATGFGTPGQAAGFPTQAPATGFATPVQPTGFPTEAPAGSNLTFNLGGTTTATTTTSALSFAPILTGAKPATTGFSLGGGEPTSSAGTAGLTFGTQNTMASAGTGFTLGATPTATTTSTTTTTAGGYSLNASGTTSVAAGYTFGTGTTASSAAGFALNTTSAAPSLTTPSTQASLGTTTTVTSSASASQPASISSFEESINKWTLELEEQEKVFVNQAAQVNTWDKLLITNGEKIVALNQEVERVKIQQQQLEHELDYVVGQQKELHDCLVPLEKELASLSVSDPEREYTYRLSEDLDTQLKRMSEDLKEIIEHLNQANRTQDSSDPIVQIGKILNANVYSLEWLDHQTTLLNQKIQQIEQIHQDFRQDKEQGFILAYH